MTAARFPSGLSVAATAGSAVEPKVATAIYQEMIAQYKIPVVMKQRLDLRPGKGVVKTGARITAIVMENGTRYTGRMFGNVAVPALLHQSRPGVGQGEPVAR